MPVVPLIYLAVGFVTGYIVGRRDAGGAVGRETSAVLEGVAKMASSGALTGMGDIQLKVGSDESGARLLIKSK